jgi:hypothetical protein
MLAFNFRIDVDSSLVPKVESDAHLFFKAGSFKWLPHKHWEIQIARWGMDTLLSVEIDLRFRGQDHAGPKLCVEVLGYMLNIHAYDSRHWDRHKNCWEEHEEELQDA